MPPLWAMANGDSFPSAMWPSVCACVLRNKKQSGWPPENAMQFRAQEITRSNGLKLSRFQGQFLRAEFGKNEAQQYTQGIAGGDALTAGYLVRWG